MMDHIDDIPESFDLGMEEANMRIRANLELDGVELTIPGKIEIVLSPTATIDLVLKLVGALARLDRGRGE